MLANKNKARVVKIQFCTITILLNLLQVIDNATIDCSSKSFSRPATDIIGHDTLYYLENKWRDC